MVQWPYMQSAAQGVIAFAPQLRYTRVIFSSIFFKDSLYKVSACEGRGTRVLLGIFGHFRERATRSGVG